MSDDTCVRRLDFSCEATDVSDTWACAARMNEDAAADEFAAIQFEEQTNDIYDPHQGSFSSPPPTTSARGGERVTWSVLKTPPTPQQVSALRQRIAWKNTGPSPPQASRLQKTLAAKLLSHRSATGGGREKPLYPPSTADGTRMKAIERQVLRQQTLLSALSVFGMGLGSSALIATRLQLFNWDIGTMAAATGQLTSVICAAKLVLGPVVAALSDRFGRRPFRLLSVLGQLHR